MPSPFSPLPLRCLSNFQIFGPNRRLAFRIEREDDQCLDVTCEPGDVYEIITCLIHGVGAIDPVHSVTPEDWATSNPLVVRQTALLAGPTPEQTVLRIQTSSVPLAFVLGRSELQQLGRACLAAAAGGTPQ